jgi:hypothetical protein
MVVASGSILLAAPILGAVVVLAVLLARGGRFRELGWLVAGAAAPWTVLYAVLLGALYLRLEDVDYWRAWLGFLAGVLPFLLGLVVATARRMPGPMELAALEARAPARKLGDVGRAVVAPSIVGPFGLPEVAVLTALVATWVLGSLLLPGAIPWPLRTASLVVISAVLGAEAWLRSWPAPARRAFEAFSWLGEWEMGQVRGLTGSGVPATERGAREWLLAHPERPEERWLRVGILVLAGRPDEARTVAERMPASTPAERLDRAAAWDLADWYGGGDGALEDLETAARDLDPADEEARLRAEVTVAVARVRRLVATETDPLEAGAPLRAVRERLGSRADGQLRRALHGRLLRTLLVAEVVIVGIGLVIGSLLPAA